MHHVRRFLHKLSLPFHLSCFFLSIFPLFYHSSLLFFCSSFPLCFLSVAFFSLLSFLPSFLSNLSFGSLPPYPHLFALPLMSLMPFDSLTDSGRDSPLLGSTLAGLSTFAHLINLDFFDDLLSNLHSIIATHRGLTFENTLHCVHTTFAILSGQGQFAIHREICGRDSMQCRPNFLCNWERLMRIAHFISLIISSLYIVSLVQPPLFHTQGVHWTLIRCGSTVSCTKICSWKWPMFSAINPPSRRFSSSAFIRCWLPDRSRWR